MFIKHDFWYSHTFWVSIIKKLRNVMSGNQKPPPPPPPPPPITLYVQIDVIKDKAIYDSVLYESSLNPVQLNNREFTM